MGDLGFDQPVAGGVFERQIDRHTIDGELVLKADRIAGPPDRH